MTMRFKLEQSINCKKRIYHRKTTVHMHKLFTVALCGMAKSWKQSKGLY